MEGFTLKRSWSFPDTQSAKALRRTLILEPKSGSPLLMLSLEDGDCRVYSPEEDRVYETKSGFSGYRFLAKSGKWLLVLDSRSNLSIIDVFNEEKIDLPPLESIKGGIYKVERIGVDKFIDEFIVPIGKGCLYTAEKLRGFLLVDEKERDYVVVWYFQPNEYLGFCKKGDIHYREIKIRVDVSMELRGQKDVVLKGDRLYLLTKRNFIRQLDLSGQDGDGFEDVPVNHRLPLCQPGLKIEMPKTKFISYEDNIALIWSEEVLIVHNRVYESTRDSSERYRVFRLYKRDSKDLDPNTRDTRLVEVDTLGDEALFLDLGITVPADLTLGIEPNSIYFTRDDRFHRKEDPRLDICVYNLATKATKRFPNLSKFKLKDAYWFLPL